MIYAPTLVELKTADDTLVITLKDDSVYLVRVDEYRGAPFVSVECVCAIIGWCHLGWYMATSHATGQNNAFELNQVYANEGAAYRRRAEIYQMIADAVREDHALSPTGLKHDKLCARLREAGVVC